MKAEESAAQGAPERMVEIPPPPGSSLFKQRWAELTKNVYEADPLLCERCGGAMRIIAFLDQPDVIENILTHLRLWPHTAHAPPPSAVASCRSNSLGIIPVRRLTPRTVYRPGGRDTSK